MHEQLVGLASGFVQYLRDLRPLLLHQPLGPLEHGRLGSLRLLACGRFDPLRLRLGLSLDELRLHADPLRVLLGGIDQIGGFGPHPLCVVSSVTTDPLGLRTDVSQCLLL
ncbi:hypothetical protein [Streptomyces luteogriseus]|uniref:hypothetical protein n=1 Tax=Streptomyces luteogriseus TaxID=68233 RepID=UPI00368095D0